MVILIALQVVTVLFSFSSYLHVVNAHAVVASDRDHDPGSQASWESGDPGGGAAQPR